MSSNFNFNMLATSTTSTTSSSTSSSSPLSINTGSCTDIPNQSLIDFSSSSGEQDEMSITKGPWTGEVINEINCNCY